MLTVGKRQSIYDVFHERQAGGAIFQVVVYTAAVTTTSRIHSSLLHVYCVNLKQQPNIQQIQAFVCLRLEMSQLYQQQSSVLFAEGK